MKQLIVISIFFSLSALADINPFTTDGCSKFIDGPLTGKGYEWLHCCEEHDIKYWSGLGGEKAQDEADIELRQCVIEAGFPGYGESIYRAVTAARPVNSRLKVSFRWGYAWDKVLGHRELTAEELESVKQMTTSIPIGIENYRKSKGYPEQTLEQQEAIVKIIERIRNWLTLMLL